MVCQQANLTFNAGASLKDAGGFEVGVHGVGSVTVAAASGGHAAATLSMVDIKVGQFAGGVGTLNLAGGAVAVAEPTIIGDSGQGTLNMSGSASLVTKGFVTGNANGGTGQVNLTGNASVVATSWMAIGDALPGGIGGTGEVTLGSGTSMSCHGVASIGTGSSVTLAGGNFGAGGIMQINQGATLSGSGARFQRYPQRCGQRHAGIGRRHAGSDRQPVGMGAVQVGANSTLDLVANKINVPNIAFMGSGGTLELATGVAGSFSISGFAAGDHLVMSGIDHADWNATTNVLSLSEHGQVLDALTLTGVAAGSSFSVTPGIGGSVIALVPSHH